MIEYIRGDRNSAGHGCGGGAGSRPDVGQVRSVIRLRSVAQKKDINAPERLKFVGICNELPIDIRDVCLHGGETLYAAEELRTQQALEIPDKAKTVFHAQRRQGVLGKHAQPCDEVIGITRARYIPEQSVKRLSPTASEQDDHQVASPG